jgi:hypothetical protein
MQTAKCRLQSEIFFLVVVFCLSPSAISGLFAGTVSQTLRFSPADLEISYAGEYAVPSLPGCERIWEPGQPGLPLVICRVLIPAGATATSVEVGVSEPFERQGEYRVLPAQMPRAVSANVAPEFVPGDSLVYSSDEPYPAQAALLQGTGEKAGFRIAEVLVYPVQYRPRTGRLRLRPEVTLTIAYQEQNPLIRLTPGQYAFAVAQLAGLVANPEDIRLFAPPVRDDRPEDLDYAVITSTQLAGSFEGLLDWYRALGLRCDVKTREWIVASYSGVDVPEQIRNFIIDYYEHYGLSHVLLAGDTQIVPCRKGRAYATPYTDDLPADLYYADLQWSWDGDSDGIWGEYGDDTVDFYSDVSVGRAPVDDTLQAQSFVNKVLGYELDPAPGYLEKLLLPYTALYSFYPARLAQDSIAAFVPHGRQVSVFTGMTTPGPIHDSIESGFGLCHVVAHGNNTGLYTMNGQPLYTVTTAGSQINGRRLPVFTSIACYSGNFEYDECLAEALMNNPDGGAVAAIMNSRYGIAQPPGCGPAEKLDIRFYDYLFHADSGDLGRTHSAAKDYYAALARSGGIWQWSIYELNLLGDPRMPVWTAEPRALFADFPRVLNFGPQQVCVSVSKNALPVSGARVRVFKDGDFDARGISGGNGTVVLDIAPQSAGRFQVVAQAPNGIPVRDSGIVRANGSYVHLLRFLLDDSAPRGNGDGVVNPGETVRLPVWVRNFGNQTAEEVSGRLRTQDSMVTVLDSSCGFGTIGAGDSSSASGLTFAVAGACTNGYLVGFQLVARDRNDSAWTSDLRVLVGTSVLGLDAFTVVDTLPGGNRNSRLDPGESAQIIVTLANTGFGNGYDVQGRLRSADTRLAVLDSSAGFGTIRADSLGSCRADPFVIQADSTIPRETDIGCTLLVAAAGEPPRRSLFLLPVGSIRTCDPVPDSGGATHRYYAYDNTDTSYERCPTYEWAEIKGRGENLRLEHEATVQRLLPFSVRYYGASYRALSICSNGWLALGSTTQRNWTNRRLPDGQTPHNMICPNWDDLDPDSLGGGIVWCCHDTTGHRFIVEWDSVVYSDTAGARDKFQVLIYDSTFVTPTRDNEIVFQYQTANYYGSSTIGIENGNSAVGIGYLFDSAYHRAAATILPGRAIRFTTLAPTEAVEEPATRNQGPGTSLRARPSVSGGRFAIEYSLPIGEDGEIVIADCAGRLVRTFSIPHFPAPNRQSLTWDGTDGRLRPVPAGVYFCALKAGRAMLIRKLLLVR